MDVAPEADYITFAQIRELQSKGWGFGSEPSSGGQRPATQPIQVVGLTITYTGHNGGEQCPPHSWVASRFGANCSICGISKDYAGEKGSSGRDRIKQIVRTAPVGTMIKCPICGTEVKSGNLLRHYDKHHQGQPVP
jgi:hypothetical protein